MKFIFFKKRMGFSQPKKTTRNRTVSQYFVFTDIELFSLVICIILDVIEYAAAVLTMPLIGDLFDVFGILVCLLMFRWIGLVSLMELLPGADVLPIYIITWLIWYFLKKQKITHMSSHRVGVI
jgi:hypothetical protein